MAFSGFNEYCYYISTPRLFTKHISSNIKKYSVNNLEIVKSSANSQEVRKSVNAENHSIVGLMFIFK